MKQQLVLLVLIVLLGSSLRLFFPFLHPPSPNWDEVSLGYNAYSVLYTGRDEWGEIFPSIFRAYGDYKLPVYVYSLAPFIQLFGLNEITVRFPSVISGIGLIIIAYILSLHLFRRRDLGLLAAFLVATQPWNLFLSRVGVEANLSLFLIALGITLLLKKKVFLAILFIGLSAWTYNSARVFAPLFLIFYYFLHRSTFRLTLPRLLLFSLLFIPMFIQLANPAGTARFNWVNLVDSGAIAQIIESRNASSLPSPISRLLYNRPVYFLQKFIPNYLNHFSPHFLFLKGGSQYQFNIPDTGLFNLVSLPLFYLGLLRLIVSPHPGRKLILLWLLLAPIAGSITRDSPHTLRALVMSVPVVMSIVYGYSWATSRFSRLKYVYLILLVIGLGYYLTKSVPNYLVNYAWSWQYGYRQAISYLKADYLEYDQIIITKKYGEPHEFVLFYWPWPPGEFTTDPHLSRYFRSDWYWVDAFAKFRFVNDWELADYVGQLPPGQKYLILAGPEYLPFGQTLRQINYPNNQPAFIIKSI